MCKYNLFLLFLLFVPHPSQSNLLLDKADTTDVINYCMHIHDNLRFVSLLLSNVQTVIVNLLKTDMKLTCFIHRFVKLYIVPV